MIAQKLIDQLNKCIEIGNKIGSYAFNYDQFGRHYCHPECLKAGGCNSFSSQLKLLLPLIKDNFPVVNKLLTSEISNLTYQNCVNRMVFEKVMILLSVIVEELNNRKASHKIFISHSSKDKKIVESFVDTILKLGMGFKSEDIFCTSIEEMGVKNGEDMHSHIQTNINGCDFAFLMISQEYNKSGICLNEMGAVWAYDKKVKTFILPDIDFGSIGWLYDIKKADRINDTNALDSLHDDMSEYYSLKKKTAEWGRQRENFLDKMKSDPISSE